MLWDNYVNFRFKVKMTETKDRWVTFSITKLFLNPGCTALESLIIIIWNTRLFEDTTKSMKLWLLSHFSRVRSSTEQFSYRKMVPKEKPSEKIYFFLAITLYLCMIYCVHKRLYKTSCHCYTHAPLQLTLLVL